tara:strand:+ start:130 stop:702 length:573 start_codon:yes stop_codon:yes gene_type:complete
MPISINGSGTVTGISVGGLPDGIVDTDMIAATAVTAAKRGTGAILQVVNAIKTDTASSTASFADTGLSASITLISSSSKILVLAMIGGIGADNSSLKAKLMRGSTDIAVGDAAGSRARATVQSQTSNSYNAQSLHMSALDTPGTGTHTYKVQFGGNGGQEVFINRIPRDSNGAAEDARTASTLTLLEVAG